MDSDQSRMSSTSDANKERVENARRSCKQLSQHRLIEVSSNAKFILFNFNNFKIKF